MTESAYEVLNQHDWPGNVRELENVIQRQVALCQGDLIDQFSISSSRTSSSGVVSVTPDVPFGSDSFLKETRVSGHEYGKKQTFDESLGLEEQMARFESRLIQQALSRCQGNQTRAAQMLGISYRQFRYKVAKLEVQVKSVEFAE
ncbi:MAG: helix-turn-helix domain-containing protein [Planctomycetota bacterium]